MRVLLPEPVEPPLPPQGRGLEEGEQEGEEGMQRLSRIDGIFGILLAKKRPAA